MERLNREAHALTGPVYSRLTVPVTAAEDQEREPAEKSFQIRASIYRDALYMLVACVAETEPTRPAERTALTLDLSHIPAVYRKRLGEQAEVLMEMAGKDEHGRPLYVRDRKGAWRRVEVALEAGCIKDSLGPYGVHVYRVPLRARVS